MEKLDLQIFRELKQEIVDMFARLVNDDKIDDETKAELENRYKEIISILAEHDLSNIDFEEWRGMFFEVGDDLPLDFSKTNANLDFSLITFLFDDYSEDEICSFKGCKIINFDFEKNGYAIEMFDEEFIKEIQQQKPELFLSEDTPKNVRDLYYAKELTLEFFSRNLQYFEGKKVSYAFNGYGPNQAMTKYLIKLYGDNIYNLFRDYKPMMDKILEYPNLFDPSDEFYSSIDRIR